ncbi:conserved Plasmodium protein, unknown function [Plasmodium malariae]|uniref:Uncharacterized protein n=1 Tax=Plasmodium malariae TaxID=5858 RepID=A0A1D3TE78_PLAMA|nr:conserved Plasmodium protein, unknown function [Plasmodium malariae]SCP03197.1 conserved Plasmodium protein, unknown function [Plasmodium malariae]
MIPKESTVRKNGKKKYSKKRLISKHSNNRKKNFFIRLNNKELENMLIQERSSGRKNNTEKKKNIHSLQENERMNKYIVHLQKLYRECKYEECLRFGLENIEKLKKKNYISKIEFLKIIGNVYFYLENYKYSSLTYILLSKYINKVSDKYKIEICYNAGVVFIKYFLESNDISFYLNAKTSFNCSLLFNERKSEHFNKTIYESTIKILRKHFTIDIRENAKKEKKKKKKREDNYVFSDNSSYENCLLKKDIDISSYSDENEEKKSSLSTDSGSSIHSRISIKTEDCEIIKERGRRNDYHERNLSCCSSYIDNSPLNDTSINKKELVSRENYLFPQKGINSNVKNITSVNSVSSNNRVNSVSSNNRVNSVSSNNRVNSVSSNNRVNSVSSNKRVKNNSSDNSINNIKCINSRCSSYYVKNSNSCMKEKNYKNNTHNEKNVVIETPEVPIASSNQNRNLKNIFFNNTLSSVSKNSQNNTVKSGTNSVLRNSPCIILRSSSHNILKCNSRSSLANSPRNFSTKSTNCLLNNIPSILLNKSPSNIFNKSSSNFLNNSPNILVNNSPNKFLNNSPKSLLNNSPCSFMNSYLGNLQNNSPSNLLKSNSASNSMDKPVPTLADNWRTNLRNNSVGNLSNISQGNLSSISQANLSNASRRNLCKVSRVNLSKFSSENISNNSSANLGNSSLVDWGKYSRENLRKISPANLGNISANLGSIPIANLRNNSIGNISNYSRGNISNYSRGNISNYSRGNISNFSRGNISNTSLANLRNNSSANLGIETLDNLRNTSLANLENKSLANLGNTSLANSRNNSIGNISNLSQGNPSNISSANLRNNSISNFSNNSVGHISNISQGSLSNNSPYNLSVKPPCKLSIKSPCNLLNKSSSMVRNNIPVKRISNQKNIIKCMRKNMDETNKKDTTRSVFNSNECILIDEKASYEDEHLQKKRRKENHHSSPNSLHESGVEVCDNIFPFKKDGSSHLDCSSREDKYIMIDSSVSYQKNENFPYKTKNKKRNKIKLGSKHSSFYNNILWKYKNMSIRNKIKKICKEHKINLLDEYYRIYELQYKNKQAIPILKHKNFSEFFHDIYMVCKMNKCDCMVKFVDELLNDKDVTDSNMHKEAISRERSHTNVRGNQCGSPRLINKHYRKERENFGVAEGIIKEDKFSWDKENIKKLNVKKYSRTSSLLRRMEYDRYQMEQVEKCNERKDKKNEKGIAGRRGENNYEQTYEQNSGVFKSINKEKTQNKTFDCSTFIKLYNEIRNSMSYVHFKYNSFDEKHYKEKREIEEVIIQNFNKINKKRIRDKVKKLSSYNNSILSNVADKLLDDTDELFLLKNYSSFLKIIKNNDNIQHIYYLYENMYAIDKFTHINSSNFFNISHFIIDILLLKQIKEKDYLKKKINKLKYSDQNCYRKYSEFNSDALLKNIINNVFLCNTEMSIDEYNNFPFSYLKNERKRKRKRTVLNEQNIHNKNIKLSKTVTVNNSDTNSYTNNRGEELNGQINKRLLCNNNSDFTRKKNLKSNFCTKYTMKNEGIINSQTKEEETLKNGEETKDNDLKKEKNQTIASDLRSLLSNVFVDTSNINKLITLSYEYNCEREKLYMELNKGDMEFFLMDSFYEYMNTTSINDCTRNKIEEITLMLFYYYCRNENKIKNVLFNIIFFFTYNNIINKKNVHQYATFLSLYDLYLVDLNCKSMSFFYHNVENDSKEVSDVKIKGSTYQNIEEYGENYMNIIHCYLHMLKLLYKCYLNKLKRKYTFDNINLEKVINYTFTLLNCLLIKYSYNQGGGKVRCRVLFLFMQFLYINAKYYFKNVSFFLDKYDINYLVKGEFGNFCKTKVNTTVHCNFYERTNKSVTPKLHTEGDQNDGQKEVSENELKREMKKTKYIEHREKGKEEDEDKQKHHLQSNEYALYEKEEQKGLDEKKDNRKEYVDELYKKNECKLDKEREQAQHKQQKRDEENYENADDERDGNEEKKDKEKRKEQGEHKEGTQRKEIVERVDEYEGQEGMKKREKRNNQMRREEYLKKSKINNHSSFSNVEKIKKVFTKLYENVNIAFSSFLKCYNKCYFILNLKLYESSLFKKKILKKIKRIIFYCNSLYSILKIKKLPMSKNYNFVFDEINYNLHNKNIFLNPLFFNVLIEDKYVKKIYTLNRNYILRMSEQDMCYDNITDLSSEKDLITILISFERLNKGTCEREKVNKKKKRFIILMYSYQYIKNCICKELKNSSILRLYKRAKELDENFNLSIDYLHSLFDTRLCMLSLDYELQNIIVEFINNCVNFILRYYNRNSICFLLINKLMKIYNMIFSIFYLRLNSFSEFNTNRLYKILSYDKNIFSYDDKATQNLLNFFHFINFRYGCSYNFLNHIFTSFHVFLNSLVKIDLNIEIEKKHIATERARRKYVMSDQRWEKGANSFNYGEIQKYLERRKRINRNGEKEKLNTINGIVYLKKDKIYKIINEVRRKVTINGKFKIKNRMLEGKFGNKINKYFSYFMGDEIRMEKRLNKDGRTPVCRIGGTNKKITNSYVLRSYFRNTDCNIRNKVKHNENVPKENIYFLMNSNSMRSSGVNTYNSNLSYRRRSHTNYIYNDIYHTKNNNDNKIKHMSNDAVSKENLFIYTIKNSGVIQNYKKLKKMKKKLKRKLNNKYCFFRYIAVVNKSHNNIYTSLCRIYSHILFVLISILYIENYNILHLRKSQDFFMNNDIYNTYYIFLHISSSIILLLSSPLKIYLHFCPSIKMESMNFMKNSKENKRINEEKSNINMLHSTNKRRNVQLVNENKDNEKMLCVVLGGKGGKTCVEENTYELINSSRKASNDKSNYDSKNRTCHMEYEIYLETLLNFSSINILLLSKKRYNRKNKIKRNKYIFTFCNLIENLLQNSMFYVDLFNNCKNRGDVLEMNDIFSKLNKLCKDNNTVDDFIIMKRVLIYHTLFKYIIHDKYVSYFQIGKNELYNVNKCTLNLFYFSLNILLTTFNTDISIHLERSLYNINSFHHTNLYYDAILNSVKKTIQYIKDGSKSSFNCMYACVLYYLDKCKNGEKSRINEKGEKEGKVEINGIIQNSEKNDINNTTPRYDLKVCSSPLSYDHVNGCAIPNFGCKGEDEKNSITDVINVSKSGREREEHVYDVENYEEKRCNDSSNYELMEEKCKSANWIKEKNIFRKKKKVINNIIYDMIIPYIDLNNIKVYNRIYRNNHSINSLINICFSFLFNNFLFLKSVYPFDIVSKDKNENEANEKRIITNEFTLDIVNMKMSEIKAVELFLSLYIHKYMQSICLDIKKLVDYNTYMNQFFWTLNKSHMNITHNDYIYLNYSFYNVYYKFNDYNVLQFLVNFKRSKSEGKEFMMSFVKIFDKLISLDEEISADYLDPLTYNIYLDYMKDLFLNDDYYYVCFYEYIKTVYLEENQESFKIDDFGCYLNELNELNPFKIKEDMKKKFRETVDKNYLLLIVKRKVFSRDMSYNNYDEIGRIGKDKNDRGSNSSRENLRVHNILKNYDANLEHTPNTTDNMRNRCIDSNELKCNKEKEKENNIAKCSVKKIPGKERVKVRLNNNPYNFKNIYKNYKSNLFELMNKKNINYFEIIKVLNSKHYNHFSNLFFSSFVHIMGEVKYDYNKQYNFNILKIMDKLNIALKASFYNNKNVILYYYIFQQYFHLYKFLEDKYFSEFVLSEYLLLNISTKFVDNALYNSNLYKIYSFLKFLYLRNVLKHTDILLNFLIYVYYKYFRYHYGKKDRKFHHFMELFLSIHEESYNNSLLTAEYKMKEGNNENNYTKEDFFTKNVFINNHSRTSLTNQENCDYLTVGNDDKMTDSNFNDTITKKSVDIGTNENINDCKNKKKRSKDVRKECQEINSYYLVLSNSQNRYIHILFFKILTNFVKLKINILNAKNLLNNLNFYISSYVKYSLFYTFEEKNKGFKNALKHKYSFYDIKTIKKNFKLCIYIKNLCLKHDLFNSDILFFLNIESSMKKKKLKYRKKFSSLSKECDEEQVGCSSVEKICDKNGGDAQHISNYKNIEFLKNTKRSSSNEKEIAFVGTHDSAGYKVIESTNRNRLSMEHEQNSNPHEMETIQSKGNEYLTQGQDIINVGECRGENGIGKSIDNVEDISGNTVQTKVEENLGNIENGINASIGEHLHIYYDKENDDKNNNKMITGISEKHKVSNNSADIKKGLNNKEDYNINEIKVKKKEFSDGNINTSLDLSTKENMLINKFFEKRNEKKISKKYYMNILKFYLKNKVHGYSINSLECVKLEDKSIYLIFLFLGKIFYFLFNYLLSHSDEEDVVIGREYDLIKGKEDDVEMGREDAVKISSDKRDISDPLENSYTYDELLLYFMLISLCYYADSLIFLSFNFLDVQQISSKNDENLSLNKKEECSMNNVEYELEESQILGKQKKMKTCQVEKDDDNKMKKITFEEKFEITKNILKKNNDDDFKKKNVILKPCFVNTSNYYMFRNKATDIINNDKESTKMIIPMYKLLVTRLKICLYYPRYFFLASLFSYKYDTKLSNNLLNYIKDKNILSEHVKYYISEVNEGIKNLSKRIERDDNGYTVESFDVMEELNTLDNRGILNNHFVDDTNNSGTNNNDNNDNDGGGGENIVVHCSNIKQDKGSRILDENANTNETISESVFFSNSTIRNELSTNKKKKINSKMYIINYYTDYHENSNLNTLRSQVFNNSSYNMEYEGKSNHIKLEQKQKNVHDNLEECSIKNGDSSSIEKVIHTSSKNDEVKNIMNVAVKGAVRGPMSSPLNKSVKEVVKDQVNGVYDMEIDKNKINEFMYDIMKLKVVIKNIEIKYEDVLNDIIEGLNFISENKNCGNYNSQAAYHICIYYFMRKNYERCIYYMKFFVVKGTFKIWQNDSFNQDYYNLYCKRVQRNEFCVIKYFTIVLEVSKNVLKNALTKINDEICSESKKMFENFCISKLDTEVMNILIEERCLDVINKEKKEENMKNENVKTSNDENKNDGTKDSCADGGNTNEGKDTGVHEKIINSEKDSGTGDSKNTERKDSNNDEYKTSYSKNNFIDESKTDGNKERSTEECEEENVDQRENNVGECKSNGTKDISNDESKFNRCQESCISETMMNQNKESMNDSVEKFNNNEIVVDKNINTTTATVTATSEAEVAAATATDNVCSEKENKFTRNDNKWIYLGFDNLDHLNDIYHILKMLFEIYVYIGKTIKRFNDYKLLEEATVMYGYNISVINILFKIITEHICFIFEVLCYFTPHVLVYPIILLFSSSTSAFTSTEGCITANSDSKYMYLKQASLREELIYNSSSASMDLRIFKLFREFLANKSATMPFHLSTRMHSVFLLICKKLLYYQKNEKDIIKNMSIYYDKRNKKKKEGIMKFVENALNNKNKTSLTYFLNVFNNGKLLNCTNYLNCENIKFLTSKLVYSANCTDINRNNSQIIPLDNANKEKSNNMADKENIVSANNNNLLNDLNSETITSMLNNNDPVDEEKKNKECVLYYIKLNNDKNIYLYDDYNIFNNIKTKNEALNCVNSMLSDKNSSLKKTDSANMKKKKNIDLSLPDVKNSIRERDLRRLNREKSKVL